MSTYELDRFFDDFLGFGSRPLSMHFVTPSTKDIQPVAKWKKDGNTYYTVVRMVGIDPEFVEVTLEDYGIHIKGESTTFGETYSQEISLAIAKETLQNINEVTYDVKNGMCQISLIMNEPEVKKIAITRLNALEEPKEE